MLMLVFVALDTRPMPAPRSLTTHVLALLVTVTSFYSTLPAPAAWLAVRLFMYASPRTGMVLARSQFSRIVSSYSVSQFVSSSVRQSVRQN